MQFVTVASDRVMIYENPSKEYAGSVWEFDPEELTLVRVTAPKKGFTITWSHDTNFVFTLTPPGEFSVLDTDFQPTIPIFFTTLPQKCAADLGWIYCFVPQDSLEEFALPDDYLQKRFFSIDDLFVTNPT